MTSLNMEKLDELHNRAMEYAETGLVARHEKDYVRSWNAFKGAFDLEKMVADMLKESDLQPTRAVIYRSAATLALDIDDPKQAKELAQEGLKRNPPVEIARELKDVLDLVLGETKEEKNGVKKGKKNAE